MYMILLFSILNESKIELFQKFFVEKSYFSDLQVKTIINSTPKLLNIVDLISKTEKSIYSSRYFTLTNLWLHIIKFKSFFYIFVTTTFYVFNHKPLNFENEYSTLIRQVDELINQCTSKNPHFDLTQNNYFNINTESLLIQFNKYFISHYSKIKAQQQPIDEIQINPAVKRKIGKYLFVCSASACKISIISQFFLNWDDNQLKNIRPTINKQINNFKDDLLNHNFNLIDLGGQVQYTEMHLNDPNLFTDVNNLIYVIDVQDVKKVEFTKNYLLNLVEKLKNTDEKPFVAIFFHKFDPEIQNQLNENVQNWIEWIDKNLVSYNLDYTYYFTSIKDNSAREALARTLLLTLPYWFLTLTIKEDLIIRSLNSLTPIVTELTKLTHKEDIDNLNKELFQQSVLFGFATTKIIIQKWINHLLNKNLNETNQDKLTIRKDMNIEFDKDSNIIDMRFKCPLLNNQNYVDLVKYPNICEITHGIITGLSQFIGLGKVEISETQIRNTSEFCKFFIFI